MQISKEKIETMINLNQSRLSNRKIADYIGCHHNTVNYYLKNIILVHFGLTKTLMQYQKTKQNVQSVTK